MNIKGEVEGYLTQIEQTAPKYAKAKAETYQLTEYKKTQRSLLYSRAVGKTVADKENQNNRRYRGFHRKRRASTLGTQGGRTSY